MPRIVIIGKGNIGNAIAGILCQKKSLARKRSVLSKNIAFWDRTPGKSAGMLPLAEIIPKADFVFLCVPSFAVPQVILEIKPYLSRRTVTISIAKGIERKSGATMDELFHRLIPRFPFVLLSGPMLASELSASMGGAAVAASKDANARSGVAGLFENTELRVAMSQDVHGVALAGILKNTYAIALGAADGMGNGYNARGFLFGTAQSEMAEMLPLLGGARETTRMPALIGDMLATGMSSASNNHAFGAALASSYAPRALRARRETKAPSFAEGTVAAPFIAKRLGSRARRFPLFEIAVLLVEHPKEGIQKLQVFLFGKAARRKRYKCSVI